MASSGDFQGTCRPHHPFDKEEDAEKLRKAMKGMGTDEAAIIGILCKRSTQQRQDIKHSFKQSFGRDLVKDLKSELSGNFENVMVKVMLPGDEFDATVIREAVKGLGTDDDALIEILCSRSNEELHAARAAYKKLFNKNLEKDVEGDTSGDYGRLLIQMSNASRDPEDTPLDEEKAAKDAKAIYDAGAGQVGTDEETFRRIFAVRSWPQLNLTFANYQKLYKKDITEAVRGELSANFKQAMMAIVSCARNRPDYFAQRLHKSMAGAGTDEVALTRLIVSRSERDMVQVKEAYKARYKKNLENDVKDDVSGDYRKALLALL